MHHEGVKFVQIRRNTTCSGINDPQIQFHCFLIPNIFCTQQYYFLNIIKKHQIMSVIIMFALLIQGCYSTDYYTFGDKLLYRDEGQSIKSISGYRSVVDISSKDCAQSCLSMRQKSGCCNSFSYNTFRRECYLKLKPSSSSQETVFNNDGFQTYTFESQPGSLLVDSVEALQDGFNPQTHSYIHKGMNQLAIDEGTSLQTADGEDFLSQVTPGGFSALIGPAECAESCNRVVSCNSFSFKEQDGKGQCYMKQSSGNRAVEFSSEGWRTYWEDSIDNCFATCQNNTFCVICNFGNNCFER
eukprot:TRINITY_DN631_c1_g1_i1.p2 TRINITY_DN631_c1_g1~~TRINITY_DN631_c1_g1_i1.p2  ORF type:complete len:299 (+),score=11.06 TRINITY_DN631_c1_g1_i1:41-937(+)